MKTEWVKWFLDYISDKDFTLQNNTYSGIKRNYSFYNILSTEVPFHNDFFSYIQNLTNINKFTIDTYHIHKWEVGSYFSEHEDNREKRKFAYVYELQESKCKTKLLVNNRPVNESWFDVLTKHEVPMITDGERISLTVFGKSIKGVI